MNRKFRLTFCTALALVAAFKTFAAEQNRNAVTLRYQLAVTAFQSVSDAFGTLSSQAITSIDPHQNLLVLNPDHPDAEKIRSFLTANDLRPDLAEVSATITETVHAHGGPSGKSAVIAKPKVIGNYDEPMTIITGDSGRTLTIELVVKHLPGMIPGGK